MGLDGKVRHSTFNLSPDVLQAINDGKIDFTIDQQPYLQGYLPVIALALKAKYGITFHTGQIGSGPVVVDKTSAAAVLKAVSGGYR